MAFVDQLLDGVRAKIAPSDSSLAEARSRRDAVKGGAYRAAGSLRTFNSGSVAHGTANRPLHDADSGLVLDRRYYPDLGPDGSGHGPRSVVEAVRQTVWMGTRVNYPRVTATLTKRSIMVEFHQPLNVDEDPSVDLVVALTRRNGQGLWIPDLHSDSWDASDPERHTELFASGEQAVRTRRARIARLAKAWSHQHAEPPLSSFNIEALAWERIDGAGSEAEALFDWFDYSARALAVAPTNDPAGVSPPIRLLSPVSLAVSLLQAAASELQSAISTNDPAEIRRHVHNVYPEYVSAEPSQLESLASHLSRGNADLRATSTLVIGGQLGHALRPTRAYGDESVTMEKPSRLGR